MVNHLFGLLRAYLDAFEPPRRHIREQNFHVVIPDIAALLAVLYWHSRPSEFCLFRNYAVPTLSFVGIYMTDDEKLQADRRDFIISK